MIKLKAPKEKKTFEEFYRKLKQEKIKPIIEKEKRALEMRANNFEKKRLTMLESKSHCTL